jgi:hypothetical protein
MDIDILVDNSGSMEDKSALAHSIARRLVNTCALDGGETGFYHFSSVLTPFVISTDVPAVLAAIDKAEKESPDGKTRLWDSVLEAAGNVTAGRKTFILVITDCDD